ncbi:MAG TPA: Ig-like domain-containing protein [Gemmatimonadales bacterium]|nr:Ig-like domain-containing protein [Gemmatimonadales bacterium]
MSTHSVRALALFLATTACSNDSLGPRTAGLATMTVVPSVATIGQGEALQLTARLVDEFGDPLEGVKVNWSSSNPEVATVSVGGTVLGRSAGNAAIRANAGGRVQGSSVQVVEDGSQGKPRPPL